MQSDDVMTSMWPLFVDNEGKPVHKWTHYFPVYDRHFGRFRNLDVVVLEIGVSKGGSLQLWKKFFGPYARIIGIDKDADCAAHAEQQIDVRIGSQSDVRFLAKVVAEFGPPDIVIDDGSHIMSDVRTTFDFLYPRISRTGVYLVEDLHTAYWPEFGGGLNQATFIDYSKHLVDELNADHSRGQLSPTEFTRSTLSMHIYDSIIVFEKGRHGEKHALITGAV